MIFGLKPTGDVYRQSEIYVLANSDWRPLDWRERLLTYSLRDSYAASLVERLSADDEILNEAANAFLICQDYLNNQGQPDMGEAPDFTTLEEKISNPDWVLLLSLSITQPTLFHDVQCMILSGLSDEDIANNLGLRPGVVRYYRHVCFDVTEEKMSRVAYMMHFGVFQEKDLLDVPGIDRFVAYAVKDTGWKITRGYRAVGTNSIEGFNEEILSSIRTNVGILMNKIIKDLYVGGPEADKVVKIIQGIYGSSNKHRTGGSYSGPLMEEIYQALQSEIKALKDPKVLFDPPKELSIQEVASENHATK